jgi:ketosteroid isomerase-like protein
MTDDTQANKQLVLDYLDAFATFDPASYEHFLTEDPVYQVGMTVRHGREGFAEVARMGRLLYPNGQEQNIRHRVIAEGDAVSILNTVIAVTNKGEPYENIYALFFEIEDGKIAKQVELLDFRVAADKFDLSVIA